MVVQIKIPPKIKQIWQQKRQELQLLKRER